MREQKLVVLGACPIRLEAGGAGGLVSCGQPVGPAAGGVVLRRDAQGPPLLLQLPAPPFPSQRGDRALGGEPTMAAPRGHWLS